MRRQRAAGLLVVQKGGKEVATRLRVEKGLRSCWADLGLDRIRKAARGRVEVGQKSRGSLLSYDERRFTTQAVRSCPGVHE
jgi:hypothetical protein